MSQNGKGDKRRPRQISREEFDKRWDAIFKKDCKHEWYQDYACSGEPSYCIKCGKSSDKN